MKVTVSTLSDELFVLDVSEDLELENFKAFCEIQSGFPAPEIVIFHNGRPLVDNNMSIKRHGVRDGDVVILQHMSTAGSSHSSFTSPDQGPLTGIDFSTIQVPGAAVASPRAAAPSRGVPSAGQWGRADDPAHVRDLFLANPDQLALLKQNNPMLADALATGRLEDFAVMLRQQMAERERRQEQRLRMMNADPFDTEAQRMIADEIRQKNIEANMEAAMEYNPETFGTVVMLYINCKVNGYQVKAFVDSGAQTTIMSAACAERVNIMRLVDTRWSGLAKGVGVQRILGRIHMVQVQIGRDFLTTSFSVLKEQPMDMLLGLDMLKRHQCSIDLKKNVLMIGTTGSEAPFLSEQDLPECARLSTARNDDDVVRDLEEREMQQALRESSVAAPGPSAGNKRKKQQKQNYLCLVDSCCGQPMRKHFSKTLDPNQSSLTNFVRQSNYKNGAQTGGSSTQTLNAAASILPSDKFGETEVKELVSLGFTREQVIAELRNFDGDKKHATVALLAKSLKF